MQFYFWFVSLKKKHLNLDLRYIFHSCCNIINAFDRRLPVNQTEAAESRVSAYHKLIFDHLKKKREFCENVHLKECVPPCGDLETDMARDMGHLYGSELSAHLTNCIRLLSIWFWPMSISRR